MIVKRFGCTVIHIKALYKCIIHSYFIPCPEDGQLSWEEGIQLLSEHKGHPRTCAFL